MIRLSAMRVSTSDRMNNLPMTAGEGEVIIAGGGALNATSQLPERGNHQNVTKTRTSLISIIDIERFPKHLKMFDFSSRRT